MLIEQLSSPNYGARMQKFIATLLKISFALTLSSPFVYAVAQAQVFDCGRLINNGTHPLADANPAFAVQQQEIKKYLEHHGSSATPTLSRELIKLVASRAISRGAIQDILNWRGHDPLTVYLSVQRPFDISVPSGDRVKINTLVLPSEVITQLSLPANAALASEQDGIAVFKLTLTSLKQFSALTERIEVELNNYYGMRPFLQNSEAPAPNIIHTISLAHIFKFLMLTSHDSEWFREDPRYDPTFRDFLDYTVDGRVSLALLKKIYSLPQGGFTPFKVKATLLRPPHSENEITDEKYHKMISSLLDRSYIPVSRKNDAGQVEITLVVKRVEDLVRLRNLFSDPLMPVFQLPED